MSKSEIAVAAALASLCLNCHAFSESDMHPPRPDRPWFPVTTINGQIIPGSGPVSTQSEKSDYTLPGNADLGVLPLPLDIDREKTYSLAELINIAASNNPVTRIAWNDARNAALATDMVESTYQPKITGKAATVYQSNSTQNTALGYTVNGNNSGTGAVAAISLEWLLFDFGERAALLEATKHASVVSNIAYTAAHQQVIYGVTIAFYAHAAARTRVETATKSVDNANIIHDAAKERYKNGIGTVIEVAQARQACAQASLALVQAKGALEDAYQNLVLAMGIPPMTKLKIADVSSRELSPTLLPSVEKFLNDALSRRPDVLGAYAAQKASLANVQVAQSEFKPKLFVAATVGQSSGGVSATNIPTIGQQATTLDISGSRRASSIFLGVTMPLYDGGSRKTTLAKASIEAENAELRLNRVRAEAIHQVVLARNALHTSLSSYSASQILLDAAQTTFDAALNAYRSGVGSLTELTLADTQLMLAKNSLSDAYNAALVAAATLALSTGGLGSAPH